MRTSKKLVVMLLSGTFFILACNEGAKKDPKPIDIQELSKNQPETHGTEVKKVK